MVTVILLLAVGAALGPTATSAQGQGWRVESVQPISRILEGLVSNPNQFFPAPDGHQVAYADPSGAPGICAFDVRSATPTCVALPPELGLSFRLNDFFPFLGWSPDSARAAMVGVPYTFLRDTDLGIADFAALSFTNLANDGFAGNLLPGKTNGGVIIDIQPAWSPDGTQVAVERTVTDSEGHFDKTTITVVDATTGAARDLTLLPGHETWAMDAGTVISLDWSPDGLMLAFSLRHVDLDPAYDGIWLLDVASGQTTRLVSNADAVAALQAIFPDFENLLAVAPLSWSPDGSRLLFWAGNPGQVPPAIWGFWMDMNSREIQVLPLPSTPQDSERQPEVWPVQAVWSPDGTRLLVAAQHSSAPDPSTITLLDPERSDAAVSLHVIDPATGEDTLLGFLPSQVNTLFRAAWGPDGDVVIDGYHLKLVQG
jgi:Tol biopolymer transport system component